MKRIILNKFWKINKDYDKEKLLYLLIDRPDYVDFYCFIWKNNKNQLHRDYNLPTKIYYDGDVVWYFYDKIIIVENWLYNDLDEK